LSKTIFKSPVAGSTWKRERKKRRSIEMGYIFCEELGKMAMKGTFTPSRKKIPYAESKREIALFAHKRGMRLKEKSAYSEALGPIRAKFIHSGGRLRRLNGAEKCDADEVERKGRRFLRKSKKPVKVVRRGIGEGY